MGEQIGVIRQAQQAESRYQWRMGLLTVLGMLGFLLILIVFWVWLSRNAWAKALWQELQVPVFLIAVVWLVFRRMASFYVSMFYPKPTRYTRFIIIIWLVLIISVPWSDLFSPSWQLLLKNMVELAIGMGLTLIGFFVAIGFKHGLSNAQHYRAWHRISWWGVTIFFVLIFSAVLSVIGFRTPFDNRSESLFPGLFFYIMVSFILIYIDFRTSIVGKASPLDWHFLKQVGLVLPDGTLMQPTRNSVEPKFQIKRIAPDKIGLRFSRRADKRYLFSNSFYGIRAFCPDFEKNTWREIAPPVRVLVPARELDTDPPKGTWQLEVDTTLMADCSAVRLWYTATDDMGNSFYNLVDLVVEQERLKDKPGFI